MMDKFLCVDCTISGSSEKLNLVEFLYDSSAYSILGIYLISKSRNWDKFKSGTNFYESMDKLFQEISFSNLNANTFSIIIFKHFLFFIENIQTEGEDIGESISKLNIQLRELVSRFPPVGIEYETVTILIVILRIFDLLAFKSMTSEGSNYLDSNGELLVKLNKIRREQYSEKSQWIDAQILESRLSKLLSVIDIWSRID